MAVAKVDYCSQVVSNADAVEPISWIDRVKSRRSVHNFAHGVENNVEHQHSCGRLRESGELGHFRIADIAKGTIRLQNPFQIDVKCVAKKPVCSASVQRAVI